MSKFTAERETITVRIPRKLRFAIDRLANEKAISRNEMCSELIDIGFATHKDRSNIKQALKECRGWFGELIIDKFADRLKKEDSLNFFQKAYLAYKLSIEQRNEIFKKLEFDYELEEAYTIDKVLEQSKMREKDETGYNIHQIANLLTIKISDFGQEYLSWYIGDDGIEKIRELKPEILPSLDVEVEFEASKKETEVEPVEILEPEEV